MQDTSLATRIYGRITHYSTTTDGIIKSENALQAAAALAAHTLILNAQALTTYAAASVSSRQLTDLSYYDSLRGNRAPNDPIAPSGEYFLQQVIQTPLATSGNKKVEALDAPSKESSKDKQPGHLFVAAPLLPYVLSPLLRTVTQGASRKDNPEVCVILAKQVAALALNEAIEQNGMHAEHAYKVFRDYFTKRLDIQPIERSDLTQLRTDPFAPRCGLGNN